MLESEKKYRVMFICCNWKISHRSSFFVYSSENESGYGTDDGRRPLYLMGFASINIGETGWSSGGNITFDRPGF